MKRSILPLSSNCAPSSAAAVRRIALFASALVVGALLAANPAQAGTIVVNGDEWTLSNAGYSQAGGSNADTFAQNLVRYLDSDGVAGGSVLVYSTNFGLTGSSLQGSLSSAGYAATYYASAPSFDLASLSGYDAIFLGGDPYAMDVAVLAAYVNAGGGVYIAAGTGYGGAAAEAAQWNGFLTQFGLELGTVYNGVGGNQPAGTGELFVGVSQLYFDNGNTVFLDGDNPTEGAGIRMSTSSGVGLIGVYRSESPPPNGVPLPGTAALLGLGLAGLAWRRHRH